MFDEDDLAQAFTDVIGLYPKEKRQDLTALCSQIEEALRFRQAERYCLQLDGDLDDLDSRLTPRLLSITLQLRR